MAEPRQPTPQDRTAIRHLAARILQSIRDDEEMALGLTVRGREVLSLNGVTYVAVYDKSDVEDLVSSLAQEVCALEAEHDAAWREGINASLRKVRYRQSVMPDLQTPAYKAALADVSLHLEAMLERGTERTGTCHADWTKDSP